MRFAVLGPVVLTDDAGAQLPLVGPRRRALLAALLLHANHPVPTDVLADAVWDGAPPPGFVTALRTLVMRLRRDLGPEAAARISTRNSGYLIQLDEAELDVLEFEALCREAGCAARARSWDLVADHVTRALTLWRGKPLADVPSRRLLDTWVVRLEGLYLQVREWRIEAELQQGRHGQVVPELDELTARHPLRESLYVQLMRALIGCGQRARALEVYRDARRVLLAELGIEPGTELRRLQEQVLAGTPRTEAAEASQPPAIAAVPRQLPAVARHFAGRTAQLDALDGLLRQVGRTGGEVVVSAISGTVGIGKTALALHWAHRNVARFPDGQLYVNLRGFDASATPMEPATVVRRFLDALATPVERIPADPEAQLDLYRSLLADRRMLIVLDNARDDDQVRPLLPGAAGCLVLVTSRNRMPGLVALDGALPLELDLLTRDEARELLAARLGADRVAAERRAADDVIELCARLPLALNIAAARVDGYQGAPLGVVARELRDARSRLDLLSAGGDGPADLRAVFFWSCRALGPPAARVFRLLGLYPGSDIGVSAAASLAALDAERTRCLLDELADAHLLAETAPGRYGFHDLLRAYAAEQAEVRESEDDRREALHRVLDHYLHSTNAAFAALYPGRLLIESDEPGPGVALDPMTDREQALHWYLAECPALLAVVTLAADAGFDAHAWRILQGWPAFLDRRGLWQELIVVGEVALAAARRGEDRAGQASVHRWLGDACSRLGRNAEARTHMFEALALHEAGGDRVRQGVTHHAIAMLYERQHQFTDALLHEDRALLLYRAVGYRAGQARALNAIGWFNAMLERHELALDYCEQALVLARELESPDIEATILDSLGYAHHHLGHHADAVTHYKGALQLFQAAGELYYQAATLDRLGDTHHAVGDTAAARDAWRQALSVFGDLGLPDADRMRAKLSRSAEWDWSCDAGI